jgi:hypothetical protein
VSLRLGRSPESPPHPQEENGADGGDEKIAEPALIVEVEKRSERAADKRTGDADKQNGEQTLIARVTFSAM